MEENGAEVMGINTDDCMSIKTQHRVPPLYKACHTAIANGYVIEGHIPAAEISRLRKERTAVVRIAAAGMPIGSPGMEIEGFDA